MSTSRAVLLAAVGLALVSLPIFEYFEWQSTPLESFEELNRAFQA